MAEIVDIALADLLLDTRNARLRDEQPSQPAAILALAQQQGKRIVKIAKDIVESGLDPLTLVGVVPTEDQLKRYVVIEGNRRVAALKALETPALVSAALDAPLQNQLVKLSGQFSASPISKIPCALFQTEDELEHWVSLRHTGQNEGVGLVEWGSDEKDRWTARHPSRRRAPAGQIIDFVEAHDVLSDQAKASSKGILSNLRRMLLSRSIREKLGIEIVDANVLSAYPASEIAKALGYVVEGFRTGDITVKDIYHAADREDFANKLPAEIIPDPATRSKSLVPLNELSEPQEKGKRKVRPKRKSRKPGGGARTAIIPKTCQLNINPPRINLVYNELLSLSADQYSNACSVLLRVFVELSVDHFVEQENLMDEKTRRSTPLAKRMKMVAKHLKTTGIINDKLESAIEKIADSKHVLAASLPNFNQYVHNEYVFPKPSELRLAWDELQPFMEKLWV